MKRYILTGAPGSGKTSMIRALEMKQVSVVDEAATDVILYRQEQGVDAPWRHLDFIDDIVILQHRRQIDQCDACSSLCFYDRSPICTYALALYLGFTPSVVLMNEINRIHQLQIYEKTVFFVDNLGFIENTDSRKISFKESLKFEKIHMISYKKFGYNLIHIPKSAVDERVRFILKFIQRRNYHP